MLEALTNGEVWYCWSSALCGQAIRTEIINTESGLPVSCWMKLEGVQIQKDFSAYHFWATCSSSHLEGQLPASISDCLTALTRALRALLCFSRSRFGVRSIISRQEKRSERVLRWCGVRGWILLNTGGNVTWGRPLVSSLPGTFLRCSGCAETLCSPRHLLLPRCCLLPPLWPWACPCPGMPPRRDDGWAHGHSHAPLP